MDSAMSCSPWSTPTVGRDQQQMFYPTLEDVVPAGAEMREFEALLEGIDWGAWERQYHQRRGQPPLHPRLVAGVILYGLMKGLRSSRQLEEATRQRLDLIWFLQGRTVDHSTLCRFRQSFAAPLADLFRHLGRRASAGAQAGRDVAVDGTRERAASERHGARTAKRLRERLAQVAEQSEELLADLARRDALEDSAQALAESSEAVSPEAMRAALARLEAERVKLQRALAVAEQRDAAKQAKDGAHAMAVRVPVTDPDSALLPNKEGGFAPNWTATVAVDVASGAILDAQIVDGAEECAALPSAVQAVRDLHGHAPEAILADGNFAKGPALKDLDEQNVQLLSPVGPPTHPAALREDLNAPVAPGRQAELPVQGKGEAARFAPEAFVYVPQQDAYYCPQGRPLKRLREETRHDKSGQPVKRWRYQSAQCAACPLASRCLKGQASARAVCRDEHQGHRDQLAQRMQTPEAQARYRKRAPTVEGVFGHIKSVMGVRQFLHRGRQAVQIEWTWVCAAFNIGKILRRRADAAPTMRPNAHAKPSGSSHKARRPLCAALCAMKSHTAIIGRWLARRGWLLGKAAYV
jgi:transposase